MYLRAVGGIALATLFVLPPRVQAQALPPESVVRPVLVEAAEEIRMELGLTDAQAREFRILIVERLMRAEAVAASFGHVTFDSVIDLLTEARSIKTEFIPQLNALLTPHQKAKLANLPRQRQLWSTVAAAWMAEARLKSLDARVNLTPDQVPAVRTQLSQSSTTPPTSWTSCCAPTTGSGRYRVPCSMPCSTCGPRSGPVRGRWNRC